MTAVLYGVSVGPGDPELLTLKAIRTVRECNVVMYPRTKGEKALALSIVDQVVDLSEKEIVPLDALITKDKIQMKAQHEKNAQTILSYLRRGISVALLTIGDVSIYATFSYMQALVEAEGFAVSLCAGVPSFCAIAAKA